MMEGGGAEMNTKTVMLSLLVLGLVVIGYSSGYSQALGSPKLAGKPPVIANFYAVEKVRYGDPLRVYIAAEDPDGDMLRIAVSVGQHAYGGYTTDWTYLKAGDQKSFKGYLQWNTMSSHTNILPDWMRVTVKVSVFDKTGNESNEVMMPIMFSSFGVSYPPPPAPFDQKDIRRLGYIIVNLYNPYKDTDRNRKAELFLFPQ